MCLASERPAPVMEVPSKTGRTASTPGIAQNHERHNMSTTLTAKLFSPQKQVMSIMIPRLGVLIAVTPHLFSSPVLAIPFRANRRLSQKRTTGGGEGSSSTAPIQIWVCPINRYQHQFLLPERRSRYWWSLWCWLG